MAELQANFELLPRETLEAEMELLPREEIEATFEMHINADGRDAKINGVNTLTLTAEDGIVLTQVEDVATLSAPSLVQGIENEKTAREDADTALGNRIDTVEDNLSQEITDRGNADEALQDNIDAEEQARKDADEDLQDSIDTKQPIINDLDTIRSNAQAGKQASNTIATYGNIVTHDVNEFATAAQGELADTALQPGDNVSELVNDADYATKTEVSTAVSNHNSSNSAHTYIQERITTEENRAKGVEGTLTNLTTSAKTNLVAAINEVDSHADTNTSDISTINGKIPSEASPTNQLADKDYVDTADTSLQNQIDTLKARGRFLALWNCATGLAETNPPNGTYTYQTGDYFIIGVVSTATPPVNYKPDGATYTTGVPSTVVETAVVDVDDVYYYDGNVWHLQINTQKTVSFVNIAGDPYDNTALATALNAKQDTISDLGTIRTNAQAGKSASDTIANYGNIVTHNTSEFATSSQGALADTSLQPGDNVSELVNDAGYLTGITSAMVTTALGYTPYNSTNPSGYITSSALNGYATESWVTGKGYITGIDSLMVTTALGYTPANQASLDDYVTIAGAETITGDKTFTEPVTIQNGQGTGCLIVGANVNSSNLTNNQRKLARINAPSYANKDLGATLIGWDTSGDSDSPVTNKSYDSVCFGGMKKITNCTSPMSITFCVTDTRAATAAANKKYALAMDANEAIFSVQPKYNGNNIATVNQIPTDIANKSLSNLTDAGNNIANWSSNVSNCITEIPQDIKLELSGGTLTLKSGSKYYKCDGSFTSATTSQDYSVTISNNGTRFVFFNGSGFDTPNVADVYSGASDPGAGNKWFNTTNNKLYSGSTGNWTERTNYSLPLAVVTVSGGAITSIDKIFNGFGYIGSTVFVLKGVSGLIPDGRNDDGTLKNTEFTVSSILTTTDISGVTGGLEYWLDRTGVYRANFGTYTYDSEKNVVLDGSGNKISRMLLDANAYRTSGKVTSFNPKPVFHAADYTDITNLQTQIDGKQAAGNYVTTDTNQTISGTKTFSNDIQRTAALDGNGDYSIKMTDSNSKGSSGIINYYASSSVIERTLVSNTTSGKNMYLDVVSKDDGTGYVAIAGTATIQNLTATNTTTSQNIATMGWVNNPTKSANVVHRTGDESIAGSKAFSGAVSVPTQTYSDSDTSAASTAFVHNLENTQRKYCIIAYPKIKLELNNGTLTLKSGSVITKADGTQTTTTSDQSISVASTTDKCFVYCASGSGAIQAFANSSRVARAGSGSTNPADNTNYSVFLNTTDKKIYTWSSGAWVEWGVSLPVGIVDCAGGTITSIDEVFNGFGHIGNTVFATPGVQYLFPYGFNSDGTYKNGVTTMTNVVYGTRNSNLTNCILRFANAGTAIQYNFREVDELPTSGNAGEMIYVKSTNRFYIYGASWDLADGWFIGPTFDKTNNGIENFNPPEIFRLASMADLKNAGGAVDVDENSITKNADDEIQTVGVIDQNNTSNAIKTWTGTLLQYQALVNGGTVDPNTIYNITDDTNPTTALLEAIYPVGSIYIGTMNTCPLASLFGTWTLVASDRVLQGSGTYNAGDTVAAGLPDITSSGLHGFKSNSGTVSGALVYANTSANRFPSLATNNDWSYGNFNIKASNSNAIYGNSTTVQPPAFVVNIWQRTA